MKVPWELSLDSVLYIDFPWVWEKKCRLQGRIYSMRIGRVWRMDNKTPSPTPFNPPRWKISLLPLP